MELEVEKKCRFYRKLDGSVSGVGIGYCDLGMVWAICDGDIKFCEEPNGFIKIFYAMWKRSKARESKGKRQSEETLY